MSSRIILNENMDWELVDGYLVEKKIGLDVVVRLFTLPSWWGRMIVGDEEVERWIGLELSGSKSQAAKDEMQAKVRLSLDDETAEIEFVGEVLVLTNGE